LAIAASTTPAASALMKQWVQTKAGPAAAQENLSTSLPLRQQYGPDRLRADRAVVRFHPPHDRGRFG